MYLLATLDGDWQGGYRPYIFTNFYFGVFVLFHPLPLSLDQVHHLCPRFDHPPAL